MLCFLRQLSGIVIIPSWCASFVFSEYLDSVQFPAKELSWRLSVSVVNINFLRDSRILELEIDWLSHEPMRISVHSWSSTSFRLHSK